MNMNDKKNNKEISHFKVLSISLTLFALFWAVSILWQQNASASRVRIEVVVEKPQNRTPPEVRKQMQESEIPPAMREVLHKFIPKDYGNGNVSKIITSLKPYTAVPTLAVLVTTFAVADALKEGLNMTSDHEVSLDELTSNELQAIVDAGQSRHQIMTNYNSFVTALTKIEQRVIQIINTVSSSISNVGSEAATNVLSGVLNQLTADQKEIVQVFLAYNRMVRVIVPMALQNKLEGGESANTSALAILNEAKEITSNTDIPSDGQIKALGTLIAGKLTETNETQTAESGVAIASNVDVDDLVSGFGDLLNDSDGGLIDPGNVVSAVQQQTTQSQNSQQETANNLERLIECQI